MRMRTAVLAVAAMGHLMAVPAPAEARTRPQGDSGTTAAAAAAAAPRRGRPGAPQAAVLRRVIAVDFDSISLADALQEIGRLGDVRLLFGEEVHASTKRVTLPAAKLPVSEALAAVLRGTGLGYSVSATGQVVVKLPAPRGRSARPGAGVVVGQVVDSATRTPIVGATVRVPEVGIDAPTGEDGRYELAGVPAGTHTLVVRSIGYTPATATITVADDQTARVDFALRHRPTKLADVVTTATGKRRRFELGNDVTVLDVDSIMRTQPIAKLTDVLEARVPGLIVQRSTGAPGDPSRLRLRGSSSAFLANDPIVIVDGVRMYSAEAGNVNLASAFSNAVTDVHAPSPLDYIDPSTIETIEVLKGPSAATLYGSDAANGVIVITTKKGRGGPAQWSARLDYRTEAVPGTYPESYLRWGHAPWNDAAVPCPIRLPANALPCVPDSLVRFQLLNDPAQTVFARGRRGAASLGVSGGSDAVTYNVGLSYEDNVGYLRLPAAEAERFTSRTGEGPPRWVRRPQSLQNYGLTTQVTARLSSKLDLSVNARLSRTEQQRSDLEDNIGSLMMTYLDRSTGMAYRPDLGHVVADEIPDFYYRRVTADMSQLSNGLDLQFRPSAWLSTNVQAGFHLVKNDDLVWAPRDLAPGDTVGFISDASGTSVQTTLNARGTATLPFVAGFQLQASTGINYTNTHDEALGVAGQGFPRGTNSIAAAREILGVRENGAEQATFGWFVEPTFRHKRFWLSTGLRLDGGNAFGSGVKLTSYPKLSGSYMISDEPFFPLKRLFSVLRLRAAYGYAGVQPGTGDRLRLYGRPTDVWVDGRYVSGIDLATFGNTKLRPERSAELELGFDADMLDDRLSLGVTMYRKRRLDALMDLPVPPSVHGGGVVRTNIAEIRNVGYEVTMSVQPVRGPLATFGMNVGFSYNRNRVVELGPGVKPFGPNQARVVEGYPLFGRWAQPVLGYDDANGDGILGLSEVLVGDSLVYMGPSEPVYSVGMFPSLTLFGGAVGVTASFQLEDGLTQEGPFDRMRAVMRGQNDPSAPLAEQAVVVSHQMGDFVNTQTVSLLRFNAVSFTYNVPTHVARRLGARTLSVGLQGSNLGLFTNYRGLDPQVNGVPSGLTITDTGVQPRPRTWGVSVNVTY